MGRPFSGSPHLYRAWLYGGRDVNKRRKQKLRWPDRQERSPGLFTIRPKHLPPQDKTWLRFVGQLMAYRPDADPVRYWAWRQQVVGRARGCCQACGEKRRLDAHHVPPWRTHPKARYDPANGQALCRTCHDLAEARTVPATRQTKPPPPNPVKRNMQHPTA